MEVGEGLFKRIKGAVSRPKLESQAVETKNLPQTNKQLTELLSEGNAVYARTTNRDKDYHPVGIKIGLKLLHEQDPTLIEALDRFELDMDVARERTNDYHRAYKIPLQFVPNDDPRLDTAVSGIQYATQDKLLSHYVDFREYTQAALSQQVEVVASQTGLIDTLPNSGVYSFTQMARFIYDNPGIKDRLQAKLQSMLGGITPALNERKNLFKVEHDKSVLVPKLAQNERHVQEILAQVAAKDRYSINHPTNLT